MMTKGHPSFWDSRRRAAYLAERAGKAAASRQIAEGADAAARLAELWPGLSDDERAILAALLALDRKSFVAPHDSRVLRGLVAKGILAYPRGHGGNWMRAARTTYKVPSAVWAGLLCLLPDHGGFAPRSRAEALLARITV